MLCVCGGGGGDGGEQGVGGGAKNLSVLYHGAIYSLLFLMVSEYILTSFENSFAVFLRLCWFYEC